MTANKGRRETFRRSLKEKGSLSGSYSLKTHASKKEEGEVLLIAKAPVVTMASTTPIYDAIQIMAKEGFRRVPIARGGTKALEGIITATDIIDYLGGGQKFEIIRRKYAGNIFKGINEPIRIIMTQNPVCVRTTSRIKNALDLMKENNIGGLPVVDAENRVKAIVTERDIMNLFADRLSGVAVEQIMSKRVVTALSKTTIFEAERLMASRGFRRLPIVTDGKVVGIMTAMDVLRFFGSGKVFGYLQSGTLMEVLNKPALEIATREVSTIEPDSDIGNAAKIMREKDFGAVPVVKDDKLVGILTERDFFKVME